MQMSLHAIEASFVPPGLLDSLVTVPIDESVGYSLPSLPGLKHLFNCWLFVYIQGKPKIASNGNQVFLEFASSQ